MSLFETARNEIDNDIMTVNQLANFIASNSEMVDSFSLENSTDFVYEDLKRNEFLRNANSISDIAEEVYIYFKECRSWTAVFKCVYFCYIYID